MNKTIGIIIGMIAVIGIGWYAINQSDNSEVALVQNSTDDSVVTEPTTNPPQASSPVVVGDGNAIPTDTTVVVTGKVTPNGAFTSYWYEYGTTPNMGGKTSNQLLGSGFMSLRAPSYITGLVKDTTYYFRLNAKNEFGQVSDGQFSFTTTHGYAAPVGSAPTVRTITASGIAKASANLDGEVTPNKGITQFWFEYGTTANLGNTTALVSVGDGAIVVPASQSLTNLAPLTTYYYRINAQNQFGTANGSILTFKTTGPANPASRSAPSVKTQTASGVDTSTATLRGTVNPNGLETTYWFEYNSSLSNLTNSPIGSVLYLATPKQSAGAGVNTVSVEADVSDLSSKTTYYFRLVAQNSVGTVRGDNETFKTK